jgi:hypothetical protein
MTMKNKKLLSITRQFFLTVIFFLPIGVLFAQTPEISSAEFYDEETNTTYCPTSQNTIESFEETIEFRTKMLFAPHEPYSDIHVEVTNSFIDENGIPQTETDTKSNKLSDTPCPENSSFYIIVPGTQDDPCGIIVIEPFIINLHYGLNTITFEAWFDPDDKFPSPCTLNVVRPKPKIESHTYININPNMDLNTGLVSPTFEKSIDFKVELTYNDYLSDGEDIIVTAYLTIPGVGTVSQTLDNQTELNSNQTVIVPAEGNFSFSISPEYYDKAMELCFDAKFDRDDLNDPPVYTIPCENPVIIFHPYPRVVSVDYDEVSSGFIPGVATDTFYPEIEFNTQITYNDFKSDNEEIIVDVFKNGAPYGASIPGFTLGEGAMITIPQSGLIPIEFDYGVNEIYFCARFSEEDYGDPGVCTPTWSINRLKPFVTDHTYINPNMDLNSGTVTETFEKEIEFWLELTYNDPLSYLSNDTIVVTAILEVDQIGIVTQTLKRRTYEDPDNKIIIPDPEDTPFKFDIIPQYYGHEMKLCFEAYFKRGDLPDPPPYPSPCLNPVTIFHPYPKVVGVDYDEVSSGFIPGVATDTFYPEIEFNTQITYNDFKSDNEEIIVDVFKNGAPYGASIPGFTLGEGAMITIPQSGLIPIEFDYGVNEIYFCARFSEEDYGDPGVCTPTWSINRLKPFVTDHTYINPNMDLNSGTVTETFEKEIEFWLELTYNDPLSYLSNDTIVVTAILEVDQIGIVTQTLKRRTYEDPDNKIIIPDPEDTPFKFDIIPQYYGHEMKLCFEAYFKRGDLPDPPPYPSPCLNPVTIFHPYPKVVGVDYDEVSSGFIPGVATDTFYPEIEFNTQITYNDFKSDNEEIIVDVFKNGAPYGASIPGFTLGEGAMITIPQSGLIPIEFDYGVNEIYFCARFSEEDYGDPGVCTPTWSINRLKPFVTDHTYINPNMDLNSGTVTETFEKEIEFWLELTYNDPLSYLSNDTIVVTAILEVDQIGIVTQTLKRRTYEDPDNKIIIPDPEDTPFKFDIIPQYYGHEMKLCFESYFKRGDLPDPPPYPSPCLNPVTIFHPYPRVVSVDYDEVSSGFNPGVATDTFYPEIEFNTLITYNDFNSNGEQIIVDVYKNGTIYNDSYSRLTSGDGSVITIPETGLIPVEFDYGANEVYFCARFSEEDYGDPGVCTPAWSINRLKPFVIGHEYITANMDLNSGTVSPTFERTIEFQVELTYNDYLSDGDTVEVTAYLTIPGMDDIIQTFTNTTTINLDNKIVVPSGDEKFIFDILDHYDKELELCFDARFLRANLMPDPPPYPDPCDNPVTIYRPKTKIESVDFIALSPWQLENHYDTMKDIYNPQISFKIQTTHNDYLSEDEKVKMEFEHIYFNSETGTTTATIITETKLTKRDQTNLEFTDDGDAFIFPLNLNDFDTHEFVVRAWFDEEYLLPHDIDSSNRIMIRYRVNTLPKITAIDPHYDKIFTEKNFSVEGTVFDTTGVLHRVELKIEGESYYAQTISTENDSTFTWKFNSVFVAGKPIYNFEIIAHDSVDFWADGSLESDSKQLRIVYLHFPEEMLTEYCPKDSLFLIPALPPGGIFEGDGIISEAGLFNPYKAGEGTKNITYSLSTTTDSRQITKDIEVEKIASLEGNQLVFHKSTEEYHVGWPSAEQKVSTWIIRGGVLTRMMEDAIEVRWENKKMHGTIEAEISHGTGCSYNLEKLVAIGYETSTPKAQVILEDGNLFVCNVVGAHHYQWFRNNEEIPEANLPYYFKENAIADSGAVYFVRIYDENDFIFADSYRLHPPETICRGCEYHQSFVVSIDGNSHGEVNSDGIVVLEFANDALDADEIRINIIDNDNGAGQLFKTVRMILGPKPTDPFRSNLSDIPPGKYSIKTQIFRNGLVVEETEFDLIVNQDNN